MWVMCPDSLVKAQSSALVTQVWSGASLIPGCGTWGQGFVLTVVLLEFTIL